MAKFGGGIRYITMGEEEQSANADLDFGSDRKTLSTQGLMFLFLDRKGLRWLCMHPLDPLGMHLPIIKALV